jgi:hypothetical protein
MSLLLSELYASSFYSDWNILRNLHPKPGTQQMLSVLYQTSYYRKAYQKSLGSILSI